MNRNIEQIQALNHAFSLAEERLLADIAALQLRGQQANQEMAEQEKNHSEQARILQRQLAEREQILTQQLHDAQQELHRLAQDRVQLEKEHAEQTSQIRQELENLLRTQAQREQVVAVQLLSNQQQAAREKAEQTRSHSEQERALQRQFAEREQALYQQLQAGQQELRRLEQDRAQREKVLSEQASQTRQELESLLRTLAQREQEVAAQLLAIQQQSAQEMAEQTRHHSEQERALYRQHADREQALSQQLQAGQQEIRYLEQARTELQHQLNERLRIEREANQHLQQRLNTLQSELDTMRNELSWRLTAPLRAVGIWFKPAHGQAGYANQGTEQPVAIPMSHHVSDAATAGTQEITASHPQGETTIMTTRAAQDSQVNAVLSLKALLRLQDPQFIESAYQILLKRGPDSGGFNYYIERIRARVPKIQILGQIANSPEARRIGVEIPGLHKAIRQQKMISLPLVGTVFQVFFWKGLLEVVSPLNELLKRHNNEFIEYAYLTLLKRSPDPEGFSYYLGRLYAGVPKIQILSQLLDSREAQEIGMGLPGLRGAVMVQRIARLPLIGTVLKFFIKVEGSSVIENRLRAVEQQILLLVKQSSACIESIEHRVTDLQKLIVQQGHQLTDITRQSTGIALNNDTEDGVSSPRAGRCADTRTVPKESTSAGELQQLTVSSATFLSASIDQIQSKTRRQRTLYYYVDHTVACPVNTGMQRLVRGLARSLIENGEQLCFVKWDFDNRQLVLIDRDELAHLSRWHGPRLTPAMIEIYPVAGLPNVAISALQPDGFNWLVVPEVTHINNHPDAVTLDVIVSSKQIGVKSAFIFYDATPLKRKELADMASKHEQYMQQLLLADLVVPISEWSAKDINSFFIHRECVTQNSVPKITTATLTGESPLSSRATEQDCSNSRLILSIGSITPHKNQLALVHAFDDFCHRHPGSDWELALIGNIHGDLAPELNTISQRNRSIKLLRNLSDEDLNRYLKECAFTVFPSLMEGFGLPILESLWHGKPCVCANFGAMAEVASGGGCLMVDVGNSNAILTAIERLIFEPELLSRLKKETLTRPLITWRDYANEFSEALSDVNNPLNKIGVIYYWIDHTCVYHANSGIQRVVRGMARALMDVGAKLIPVKWDRETQFFCPASHEELVNMSRWNGPPVGGWLPWNNPATATPSDWLLIPELVTDPAGASLAQIKQCATTCHLRTAWVFYDAIPWKMRDIYTPDETARHGAYMAGLNEFDLVLSISEFSRSDLVEYIQKFVTKVTNLEDRVHACVLPGEFKESTRILQTHTHQPGEPIRILCVCTIEPRKNHLALLEAFKQLVSKTNVRVELCLVGGAPFPKLAEQVQHYIDTVPGIRWERNADDARLRALYDACDFTVYPSLEEGFGLPILESLWYARPCVCRDSGAMAEVGAGGGCLMIETAHVNTLAGAMLELVINSNLRESLAVEAVTRQFRTWNDYAYDAVVLMANERHMPVIQKLPPLLPAQQYKQENINLTPQPQLSICISTYNRSAWLALSLKNFFRLIPVDQDEIELVVCDNASTDDTPNVVQPYLSRSNFRYYRNPSNVGMLGNLRVTAHHARGRHIWILGDDDLVKSGCIERVLKVLREQPDLALVYLNYAYTREDNATAVKDIDQFLAESTPIVPLCADASGPVYSISTKTENFFTAIYCLVFRRDHALLAYSQNTAGRPFSTMLTCIPTTYHVLHHMMNEPAYWIGEPLLVVNLNVSWMKYASLWLLERLPETFDLAEKMGSDRAMIDELRSKHVIHFEHWLNDIYINQTEPNYECFSLPRLILRFKHIKAFRDILPRLKEIYTHVRKQGAKGAVMPTNEVFKIVS